MYQKSEKRALLLILFLGCILRIAAIFVLVDVSSPPDWEYGEIARNVVSGNGYARMPDPGGSLETTSSHAPLYPYFLALFYQLGTHATGYATIFIVQAVLSTLTAYILYRLALIFNTRVALMTSTIAALYPPLIYYSAKLTPTTLFLFLLSLSILLLVNLRRDHHVSAVVSGGVVATAMLCNPIAGAILPAFVILSAVKKEIGLRSCVLVCLGVLIVAGPWTYRNYQVHQRLIPITTQFPINLWIGNNPRATGTDYYESPSSLNNKPVLITKTLSRSTRQFLSTQQEIVRQDFFLREALEFIKGDPIRFAHLIVLKTWYYWWFAPLTISGSLDNLRYRIIYSIVYVPLVLIGIVGVIIGIGLRRSYTVFTLTTIAVLSATHILTHVGLLRYRIPAEMMLIPFAALALDWMVCSVGKHIRTSANQRAEYQRIRISGS